MRRALQQMDVQLIAPDDEAGAAEVAVAPAEASALEAAAWWVSAAEAEDVAEVRYLVHCASPGWRVQLSLRGVPLLGC